jgi:hypothetical protein
MADTIFRNCQSATAIQSMPSRSTARLIHRKWPTRYKLCAATPQPMLPGHSIQLCCARKPYGIYRSNWAGPVNSSRKQYLIVQLPALTAEIGESHPPPNSNPGPSDATNIGRRGRITTAREASSAKCKAAAQVLEPKFPRVSATMGNRSSATPDFLASSATSRGLG